MAKAGPNTNRSQFFICTAETRDATQKSHPISYLKVSKRICHHPEFAVVQDADRLDAIGALESDRPHMSEVEDCDNVPVIDLGSENRSLIAKQIADACREYGFFQVINHGVLKEIVDKILGVAHELFSLPVEEKVKLYSDDPSKTMRLSMSFNVKKETVHNWMDYLRLHCYPLEKYVPEWPSNPSSFK